MLGLIHSIYSPVSDSLIFLFPFTICLKISRVSSFCTGLNLIFEGLLKGISLNSIISLTSAMASRNTSSSVLLSTVSFLLKVYLLLSRTSLSPLNGVKDHSVVFIFKSLNGKTVVIFLSFAIFLRLPLLSWWPVHYASSEYMKVKMKNRLSCLPVAVHNKPEATFCYSFIPCNLISYMGKMSYKDIVVFFEGKVC